MSSATTSGSRSAASCVAVILILVAFLGIGAGIWYLFSTLKTEVAVSIAAGTGTVFVTLVSIIATRYFERQSQVEQELRLKKVPVYEAFIEMLFKTMFSEKLGRDPIPEKELLEYFAKFTQDSLIWGSDGVVKAFGRFRQSARSDGATANADSVWIVEQLLFEIRKDLGHQNRGLKRGDLLAVFVNDIEQARDRR